MPDKTFIMLEIIVYMHCGAVALGAWMNHNNWQLLAHFILLIL